jgi:two-component system cell cycle response regulator DivK
VLVADDDPSIRTLVVELLADDGFLAWGAADGERLLRLLALVRPGAIVLDIRMPVLDGYGVMARLLADPALREIPVVAVSAEANSARALAAGCRAFVPKPFDVGDLLGAVHAAVESRRLASPSEPR